MRFIGCDVCETQFGPDTEMMEMMIPAGFFNSGSEEPTLHLDVCGWQCLSNMAAAVTGTDEEPEAEGEVEQKKTLKPVEQKSYSQPSLPSMPTFGDGVDPEEIARMSERATGVKRKY